jgi:hypothetical protein
MPISSLKSLALEVIERNKPNATGLQQDPKTVQQTMQKKDPELLHASDSGPSPPFGQDGGILTLDDLPALREKLEAQGWKVVQRGSELFCTPKNGLTIQ